VSGFSQTVVESRTVVPGARLKSRAAYVAQSFTPANRRAGRPEGLRYSAM